MYFPHTLFHTLGAVSADFGEVAAIIKVMLESSGFDLDFVRNCISNGVKLLSKICDMFLYRVKGQSTIIMHKSPIL